MYTPYSRQADVSEARPKRSMTQMDVFTENGVTEMRLGYMNDRPIYEVCKGYILIATLDATFKWFVVF